MPNKQAIIRGFFIIFNRSFLNPTACVLSDVAVRSITAKILISGIISARSIALLATASLPNILIVRGRPIRA